MTRRDVRLLGLFFLLPAAFFFWPFVVGRTPYLGDITFSFQPWLTYAAQEIQAGRLPLWNPHSACGEPFMANPQVMLFHPPAVLFWLFPFAGGWRLFLCLNQALIWAAAALLARQSLGRSGRGGALLAALAVAWGGFTVVHWEFPGVGATLAPLLFLVLFSRAGGLVATALATALLFLGGYTQLSLYGLLIAGAAVLWRSAAARTPWVLARWGVAVAGGVALALVQILPSLELTRHSLRAAITIADARQYLLTPALLVKVLVPDVLDRVVLPFSAPAFGAAFWPVQRNWLSTFYVGTAPLILAFSALFSRRGWRGFWVLAGGVFLLLALGVDPFFSGARALVPGFRYMTHFSNAAVVTVIAAALLGGAGVARPRRAAWAAGGAALGGLLFAAVPGLRAGLLKSMVGLPSLTAAQDQRVTAAFLTLSVAAAGTAALVTLGRGRTTALLLWTLGELMFYGAGLHPTAPSAYFHTPFALGREFADGRFRLALAPETMERRVMAGDTPETGYQSLRQAGFPSIPLPFRISQAWSYEVFGLQRVAEFRRLINRNHPTGAPVDFMAVSGMVSHAPLERPWVFTARAPNALFYRNPLALDRLTRVADAVTIPGAADRLAYLKTGWDPRRQVVLEEPAPPVAANPGGVDWQERPGRITAWGRGAGWLVNSGVFFPGWEAYGAAGRTKLFRANHAFQAVTVPEGDWRVWWVYRPGAFRAGMWAGVGLLTGLGFWGLRRARAL